MLFISVSPYGLAKITINLMVGFGLHIIRIAFQKVL
jgi:hypothetical protein